MKLSLVLLLVLAVPASAATRRRPSAPVAFPACTVVAGTPAVTFSRDGGQTLAPVAQKLEGVGYTNGLAALDSLTMLSIHKQTLSISTDAGCNWRAVGDVAFTDFFPPQIAAAGRDRAYIWSDARPNLARYRANAITNLKPPADIIGLAVDRAAADHLRIGGADGSLWESFDARDSWSPLGKRAVSSPLVYRAAFDPTNLDHLLFGAASEGAVVSFDGGKSYSSAQGLGTGHNVFSLAVSPADPNIVWAMAIRLSDTSRHIFLSRNGGRSFLPVVDDGNGVQLVNGPLIVPHLTDPNILYFVFGSYFQAYGTDLFRYDASSKQLTLTHHAYDDFDAIAFSPSDANVMYFGLETVKNVQ